MRGRVGGGRGRGGRGGGSSASLEWVWLGGGIRSDLGWKEEVRLNLRNVKCAIKY